MGEAFIRNYSSNKPQGPQVISIHTWRIRPLEAIGYYERIIPESAYGSLEGLGDSTNDFRGVEPYYEIATSDSPDDVLAVYDYDDSAYYFYIVRARGDESAGFGNYYYGANINIGVQNEPIYADWEFKMSTDPNLYPTDLSTIDIDGVEYECEYLGV